MNWVPSFVRAFARRRRVRTREAIPLPPTVPPPVPAPSPQVPPDTTIRIDITLPNDRSQPGLFCVSDAAGKVMMRGDCLGKADNQRATAEGNPTRNPVLPYGDTPTGGYQPTFMDIFLRRHPRMGLGAIWLIGGDGAALQARMGKDAKGNFKRKRTGLALHAGRGDVDLIPTYGCIRIRDRDFAQLAAIVGKRSIVVSIVEA